MAFSNASSKDKSNGTSSDPKILFDYLQYLDSVKGISSRSIASYRNQLLRLFRFLLLYRSRFNDNGHLSEETSHTIPTGIDTQTLSEVNLQELHAFLTYLKYECANTENTRGRYVTCIRSFFYYLVNKVKKFNKNPALGLETPKYPKTQPRYLNLEESLRLLYAIRGENFERDYAIITLFLNTGIRMSELTGIDRKDIRDNCITILGKGDKERTAYLNTACQCALDAYLKTLPSDDMNGTNALFLNKRMQRIKNREVNSIIKKHITAAGMDEKKYSAHKLRHTAATLMYKHGKVDIRALQAILGHTKIETTMIYTHLDEQTLRDAMDRNPLAQDASRENKKTKPKPRR